MASSLLTESEPVAGSGPSRAPRSQRLPWVLGLLLILLLGAIEDWFGKTDSGDVYGSDAVQYLDCARAISRGDFLSAMNPLWSQGYPAALALLRPLFAAGPQGDWLAAKGLNFAIFVFGLAMFLLLLREIERTLDRRLRQAIWMAAAAIFVASQVCLDQVSRVSPDEWVGGLFFAACALLLRLRRSPSVATAVALGAVLAIGFLVKAVFLPLGLVLLAVAALAVGWRRAVVLAPAALLFALVVGLYGWQLSKAVGRPTLGEAGALNYAWHVNRLAKWVHWEGGLDPADKAWPKPWIARFTRWDSDPPDFGLPIHPTQPSSVAGLTVYSFRAPIQASYVPYYNPAYFYDGYRHIVRWRFQVVALGKSLADLALALARWPMGWALAALALLAVWWRRRGGSFSALGRLWPLAACAVLGVLIYLPVHLEGRYLASFFAVLGLVVLAIVEASGVRPARLGIALIALGLLGSLAETQLPVWARVARGWTYKANPEWKAGQGVVAAGLPPGSEVGMISWTPNLHCDWAYMAGVRITSEIETPQDEDGFWKLAPAQQAEVLQRFHDLGAQAVLTWEKPPPAAAGWIAVGSSGMWMYRFRS